MYGLSARKLLLLCVVLLSSISFLERQIPPVNATTWSSPTQVPLTTVTDTKPSAAVDNFSSIWLVYQSSPFGLKPEIYYKIYNFIAWTPEALVTSDPSSNISPNIYALSNTTLFVAWVSNRTGFQGIWFKTNNNGIWSTESQISNATLDRTQPSDAPTVTQDSLGRIWVAWYRTNVGTAYLYYRVYTPGSGWAKEVQLTNNTTPDILPTIRGTNDGRVWIIWISLRTGNYNLFSKYFDGSTWSPDVHLSTYKGDDFGPSLIQSRDGTIWVAWSREIQVGPNTFASDIYYKNSTNMGSTWSADTTLTTSTAFNDFNPSLVQSTLNKLLYVFWSSDMPAAAAYSLFYASTGPIMNHDLAVTKISVSPGRLYQGGLKSIGQSPIVSVNFTVTNIGDFTETSTFNVLANTTSVSTGSFTLLPGGSVSFQTTWNTTGQPASCMQIKASATPVSGEITVSNNIRIWGYVALIPLGDFNLDGSVDIIDAGQLALAFGSTPSAPHWLPAADFNNNGVIDIIDAGVLAFHFNQTIRC